MTPEIIGGWMLVALVVSIFVGFPIAFTLIILGLGFGYWGFGDTVFHLLLFQTFATMKEQTLAQVPLFIFMGLLLERAGLMERLFLVMQKMFGGLNGSLYLSAMFVATLFGAASGIAGASVTLLGIMAARSMDRSKYDVRLSAGIITSGGTLGILIPPSVMLVVMGPVMGVPVTDLYAGALIPGVMLAAMYAAYALIRCYLNPSLGPALPPEERAASVSSTLIEFAKGMIPISVLLMCSLGAILGGVATPTEGAALGAFGSLTLVILYRRLTWPLLYNSVLKTIEVSCMILFLVAASNFFGGVFSRLGTPEVLSQALLSLELNKYVILLIIMAAIFLLAWPLEWVPIVLIFVPIVLPMVKQLGFDMTWFAILIAVNLQTAWLSPPVALSAYFLKGVAPQWQLSDIYMGMLQFMMIQLVGLALVMAFPQLVLWLPGVLYGK
ncbi:MAG: TRAP transporter large permease subunit [Betaproteobacteria bacterium]|nr:TRAP transporter large permease subunit [Betaproteobacteria bacterium]